ncbi:MAG: hypothetical protein RL236_571 [Pseudomonadota bacterium]|jgi:type I restriction enzyme M protein
MAVVLPQGRFNNSSDKNIREYISEHCRILAVVGLHGNVFKPHTGTKTSVLLVQKWDDKLCPKVDDYPIFFATMQEPSKDNSGDKIYVAQADGSPLLDSHEHLIVKHDLFNHDGLTQDGIAEAFVEFAKKENLSFFDSSPFDEVSYRALLEGLEISEITLFEVIKNNQSKRIDSEYFKKRFLKEDGQRKYYLNSSVGEIAFVTDGQHGYHEVDELSNIHHLTAKNAKNWFADTIGADKIAKWVDDNNQRSSLKDRDIILSTRGSVGYCALVTHNILPANIDQDVARIALFNENDINAEYLLTYLNSSFGQDWILRNCSGMVQQGLPLAKVRDLPIPILKKAFQNVIKNTVQKAYQTIEQSKTLYSQAENLLLDALGIANFSPCNENINIKSFKDSFLATGRLDAEYYQPKYEEIETKITSNEFFRISDVYDLLSSPSPSNYLDSGIKVIKTKNVRIPSVETKDITDHTEETKTLVKKNDLLFASMGVGSLGRLSYINNDIENCTVDGTIKIFRCKTEFKNLYFEIPTLLFLTSKIGQELIYKYVIGSTGIISISKDNVENLIIPKFDFDKSKEISNLVLDSIRLKAESETLLELAKRAVEMAIEEDEAAAMGYLENEK